MIEWDTASLNNSGNPFPLWPDWYLKVMFE
jgi:hypothetical protein